MKITISLFFTIVLIFSSNIVFALPLDRSGKGPAPNSYKCYKFKFLKAEGKEPFVIDMSGRCAVLPPKNDGGYSEAALSWHDEPSVANTITVQITKRLKKLFMNLDR